ncbi:hypothetical protein [uncultured Flavobacterium sp.]|uniref:hypothetical protein n=1 Tax=uncultured Flavobacterium sp. TaxID=165435 RepID=UPI0030C8D2A5
MKKRFHQFLFIAFLAITFCSLSSCSSDDGSVTPSCPSGFYYDAVSGGCVPRTLPGTA